MKLKRPYKLDHTKAENIKCFKKKSRPRKERRCPGCWSDISHRHHSAKRCIDCAYDRAEILKKISLWKRTTNVQRMLIPARR